MSAGWVVTFAIVSLASAFIGAILEYCLHAVRHGKKDGK